MVIVFEGARNSGKTYLSKAVAQQNGIPRFQFNFVGGFNLLGLSNSNNREAHTFSMGKELMLLQMVKELTEIPTFIHDRGILTVLSWGLLENRVSESEIDKQISFLKENSLLDRARIVYIYGQNPDQSARNKDQWDYADQKQGEAECFNLVMEKMERKGISVIKFENKFTPVSSIKLGLLLKNL